MSEYIHKTHGSGVVKYFVGFVLSVVLTLAAFWPVMNNYLAEWSVSAKVVYLLGLALVQMMVQIAFFLHLTDGSDAKYNLMTMWGAVVCVFIIISGTWWTMWHLNYQVMGGAGRVEQGDALYPPSGNVSAADSSSAIAPSVNVEENHAVETGNAVDAAAGNSVAAEEKAAAVEKEAAEASKSLQ